MKKRYFTYWLAFAVVGLVLIGLGLSLFGEAIIAKYEQESWFWLGTGSLVIINSGISLVGQSVVYRLKYIREKEQ
jgi:hypothetical protein